MKHLDPDTLGAYRAKRLRAAELLEADEHLAACEECRDALVDDDSAAADSLIGALTGTEVEHLGYDTLESWVDGTLTPRQHRAASAHLQSCAQCVADIADLREVAASVPAVRVARNGMSLKVAAAILLAVLGVASWVAFRHLSDTQTTAAVAAPPLVSIQDGGSVINVDGDGVVHGVTLSPTDAAAVRAALMHGRIDVSPAVAGLQRERGTLMGSTTPRNAFDVVAPVATLLRSTRPNFAWTSLGDRVTYRVEVYDEARNLVMQSPEVHDLAWTADHDLARGHDYVWQVIATRQGERVVAPQPPAPEAHFGVVAEAAAVRLDTAARSGSHLVLALASAREGAVDDARRELEALARLNPGSSQVQRLVSTLKK
jgi:hypothetical protein